MMELSKLGKLNNMGCTKAISSKKYPKQGKYLGMGVEVCFNYDTSHFFLGRIIRDDDESPGLTIILLENGWVVKSTECQYRVL